MRVYELHRDGGAIGRLLADARRTDAPRTGLHCSTIVNDILQTLDPKRYAREIAESTRHAYQETGNLLEDALATQLRSRVRGWCKPRPRTFAGIIGSPDGWRVGSRTIDEIKVTWVSDRDFLTTLKWQAYLWQGLFYMAAFGARRLCVHVLFVRGPMGFAPSMHTYTVLPTKADVCRNTERLVQHAQDKGWL